MGGRVWNHYPQWGCVLALLAAECQAECYRLSPRRCKGGSAAFASELLLSLPVAFSRGCEGGNGSLLFSERRWYAAGSRYGIIHVSVYYASNMTTADNQHRPAQGSGLASRDVLADAGVGLASSAGGRSYALRIGRDPLWDARAILRLRRHMRLTQAELAVVLNARQQTVSEWETGRYRPRGSSARLLTLIADQTGFQYRARAKRPAPSYLSSGETKSSNGKE